MGLYHCWMPYGTECVAYYHVIWWSFSHGQSGVSVTPECSMTYNLCIAYMTTLVVSLNPARDRWTRLQYKSIRIVGFPSNVRLFFCPFTNQQIHVKDNSAIGNSELVFYSNQTISHVRTIMIRILISTFIYLPIIPAQPFVTEDLAWTVILAPS